MTRCDIAGDPRVSIAVREVVIPGDAAGVPVLLVHGAAGDGLASFDVPVPGYSLAEDFARAGHATYLLDVRGWGNGAAARARRAARGERTGSQL